MEIARPEIRIFIHAWNPDTGKAETLASVSLDEYTVENLQAAISDALGIADRLLGCAELPLWLPQVSVWLWSNRGLRARMQLSQDLIQRIAAAGASVDFDPYMYEGMEFLMANVAGTKATLPEISAMINCVGSVSEYGRVVATLSYEEYTFENVEAAISSLIENSRSTFGEETSCTPQVIVRPLLKREDRASMHFSASLVRLLAEAKAALDFDPSVYEEFEA